MHQRSAEAMRAAAGRTVGTMRRAVVLLVLLAACSSGSGDDAKVPTSAEQAEDYNGSEDEQRERAEQMRPDDAFQVGTETFGSVWVFGPNVYPETCAEWETYRSSLTDLTEELEDGGAALPSNMDGFTLAAPGCL